MLYIYVGNNLIRSKNKYIYFLIISRDNFILEVINVWNNNLDRLCGKSFRGYFSILLIFVYFFF